MKGPFFVKEKDGFVPALVCKDCAWLSKDETCCMHNCPFIGYFEEDDTEDAQKGEKK